MVRANRNLGHTRIHSSLFSIQTSESFLSTTLCLVLPLGLPIIMLQAQTSACLKDLSNTSICLLCLIYTCWRTYKARTMYCFLSLLCHCYSPFTASWSDRELRWSATPIAYSARQGITLVYTVQYLGPGHLEYLWRRSLDTLCTFFFFTLW